MSTLTWHGFFAATAYAAGSGLFVLLMGSVGVPLGGSLMIIATILATCLPASSLITCWVEGSRFEFTVGGASFAGALAAVGVPLGMDALSPTLGFETPFTASVAALAIVYVLGESIGRLACISFGCCFGKPVDQSTGWVKRFSEKHHFVSSGPTKKIAFAASLAEVPVVPVQGMTASLYGALTLCGLWLYFEGLYGWVIPATITSSQAWRVYSEGFRADYRGPGDLSAYQVMAGITAAFGAVAPFVLPDPVSPPTSLPQGLDTLWNPAAILALQGVWLALFHFMGRSTQTQADLRFHVRADRI